MKNKFIKILLIFFLFWGINLPSFAQENFNQIYDSLDEADFEYIFGIDPYQAEEYTQYMFSPYPLLRVGVNFVFKNTVIPAGFYLLTPRKHKGRTYILFKEQGRVKYAIPCYKTDLTTPEMYDEYIPKPKQSAWKKFKVGVSDTVGTFLPKKTQRKPIPKAYMEINDIDGEFFQVILYYDTGKYYLIFKQDNE